MVRAARARVESFMVDGITMTVVSHTYFGNLAWDKRKIRHVHDRGFFFENSEKIRSVAYSCCICGQSVWQEWRIF